MECFEATMVTIMDKMAVSAFYTGIYTGIGIHSPMGDTGKLHEVLGVALPELYAAIIVFTIKARYYFNARCKLLLPMITEQRMLRTKKTIQGSKKLSIC